jgi:heme/copper-type cytochrome/quinol oxidase subunit 2
MRALAALCALGVAGHAWAQAQQSYTYVKVSLGTPWALYFMFLALVTVPFAVMIWLAWRARLRQERDKQSGAAEHG